MSSKAVLVLLCAAGAVQAGVVSQEWRESILSLRLDDGAAEIEWISPMAFRVARSWGAELPKGPAIAHSDVPVRLEDGSQMISRYLTVELDRQNLSLRVRNGVTEIARVGMAKTARGVEVRFAPMDRVYGLGGGGQDKLNLRGEKLLRGNGFFFTSNGYGVFMRAPALCAFDFSEGIVEAQGSKQIEFVFYYGPSPKEILERHTMVVGRAGEAESNQVIDGWTGIEDLVRTLNEESLSAVLHPGFNVSVAARASDQVRVRAADLGALVPGVHGVDGGDRTLQAALAPYLATYRQETLDRGYPLIRPLAMEYPRDGGMEQRADLFLMGDELLVAPVMADAETRRVDLPRGSWTDLRTNVEYQGRRVVDVEAPAGTVPVFARNGSVVPMTPAARPGVMELHYFPSLAGEFFLWEPELWDNSQFHAAPAGEDVRVEIETKVSRTYEWVLHHADVPRDVSEETRSYLRVEGRAELRDGTWWHDDERNDLYIVLRAEAGSDRVVNVVSATK